jgi:hypothetical protein
MDVEIPDDYEPEPEEQAVQALEQADHAPKKKKPAPAPASNPKRDAARARVQELIRRKTP